MIVLSSFERLKRILCVEDNPKNRASLTSYLYAVSSAIQAYIDTDLEKSEKIEYFDIHSVQREFWMMAVPIESITLVEHDFDGQFNGAETVVEDTFLGKNFKSIVLEFPESPGKRTLKFTYIGGVSASPTISTFGVDNIVGAFIVGKFARGSLSGAVGIVKSFNATAETIQIDNLYGVFQVGDELTMQNTEGGADIPNISADLVTVTLQSLVEARPEIALACELQIRYNVTTMQDFEVTKIEDNETDRRDTQTKLTYRGTYNDLQPEVRSLLNRYRRIRMS